MNSKNQITPLQIKIQTKKTKKTQSQKPAPMDPLYPHNNSNKY